MNLAFYSSDLESSIVEEIMEWSSVALEVPNEDFNGLPPCPYAKQAWLDEKVAILFKYEDSYQCLYSTISQFDDKFDLVIIVDLSNDKEPEAFHNYWEALNLFIAEGVFIDKDMWVMGFHPDDEPSDFVEEIVYEAKTDTPYALIFVQRLSKLQKAADKLDKNGYYDNYDSQYNVREIYQLREKLYRRLKNGNETS